MATETPDNEKKQIEKVAEKDSNMNEAEKVLQRRFNRIFISFAICALVICFLPLIFTSFSNPWVSFGKSNEIGDTIGGTMGPFVALIAAFLTFFAFWEQYKANRIQREQFEKEQKSLADQIKTQTNDSSLVKFESTFYEMLKIHNENVKEFRIRAAKRRSEEAIYIEGRRCFHLMFRELRMIDNALEEAIHLAGSSLDSDIATNRNLKSDLVYRIFFFGIGEDSERQLTKNFSKEQIDLFNLVKPILKEICAEYNRKISIDKLGEYGGIEFNLSMVQNPRYKTKGKLKYYPFQGHVSRLGHTYRHLYQMVKFVVEQKETLLNLDAKLHYLRILRAQLSNHEQLLLYYNGLSIGYKWFTQEYFTTYRMIHNLPYPLADFGIQPLENRFIVAAIKKSKEMGKKFFEWDETRDKSAIDFIAIEV